MNNTTQKDSFLLWGITDIHIANAIMQDYDVLWISSHKKADIHIHDFFKGIFKINRTEKQNPQTLRILQNIAYKNYKEIHIAFSRHLKEGMRYLEIETNIDECINYISTILENIRTIVFANIPHEGPDILIYYYAIKNKIPIFIFYQSLFPNYSFILKKYSPSLTYYKVNSEQENINLDKTKISTWYMKKKISFFSHIKSLLKTAPRKYPSIILTRLHQKKLRQLPKKYITFYLHLQPEMTTSALAGKYVNQLLAIELVHKYLPTDTYLLIKENPKQSISSRPDTFLKKISKMDRTVYFKSSTIPNDKIIKNSTFIATISGTVGWEAINTQKKVLIFGNTWYDEAPNVWRIKNNDSEEMHQSIINSIYFENFKKNTWNQFKQTLAKRAFQFYTDPAYYTSLTDYQKKENASRIKSTIVKILNTKNYVK